MTIPNPAILLIGASSAIAQAYKQQIKALNHQLDVPVSIVSVSRQGVSHGAGIDDGQQNSHQREVHFTCDHSETEIAAVVQSLSQSDWSVTQVIIFNGLLHDHQVFPEKQLSELHSEQLQKYFSANVITPMAWVAKLPELGLTKNAQICVLSARVGSISDNRLGGWYGYRSTKAALNMMVKCASIELKRKHKAWQFVLFHPGTTDSPLSQPFQQKVAPDKLFSAQQTASYLYQVLKQVSLNEQTEAVDYLDWQGKTIQW